MRHDKLILGWTVLGLLALALVLGVGVPGETHTTHINGSRVQSPSFNATGNISVGANSSTYLDNWGARFNKINITGANISTLNAPMDAAGFAINNPVLSNATATGIMQAAAINITSNLSMGASNLSIYPNGTIANAVMVGCTGCGGPTSSNGTGKYAGNGGTNRAIAHGCGKTPIAFLWVSGGTLGHIIETTQAGILSDLSGGLVVTVTAMDSTNVYVSASGVNGATANTNAQTYSYSLVGCW